MMTHPPGPWKQIEYDDWLYIGGDDMDYVEYDPTNEPYNYAVINAVCVIDHIDNITKREEANATLIAAAPDLLAALEFMISNCPECDGDGVIYDDDYWTVGPTGGPCPICQGARAAIAKATQS